MALDLCGLDYEQVWVPLTELKSEAMLKLNPNGKVPVLETADGPIYETNAILRYAARTAGKAYGATAYEQAQVDQWLDWVNCDLMTLGPQFLYQIFGFEFPTISYQKDGMFKGKAQFLNKIKDLNQALADRDFIVGTEMTIADVAIVNATVHFLTFCMADKQRKGFANVFRWLEAVAQNAAFQKWFGRLRLLPKPLNFAKIEAAPKPQKQQKKKQKKQQAAPKPKKKRGPDFPDSNDYPPSRFSQ